MEVADDIQSAKKNIKIVGITEVLLQSPILNMIIVDAKIDHNDLDITENHNSSKFVFTLRGRYPMYLLSPSYTRIT